MVLAVRPGHPLARGSVTPGRYAAAGHITVSRRGRLGDPLDEALEPHRLHRRVVAAAPTVATALQLVRDSDLVVAVPELTSAALLSGLGLRTLPLPIDVPAIPVYLAWHQRYDGDPEHAWLRDLARSALKSACRPPVRQASRIDDTS